LEIFSITSGVVLFATNSGVLEGGLAGLGETVGGVDGVDGVVGVVVVPPEPNWAKPHGMELKPSNITPPPNWSNITAKLRLFVKALFIRYLLKFVG
jgi:hypothetical protein